jgi:hypothetical protein
MVEPLMEKMKFRSSANAEDIPNFDGAGLHDSFSVKLSSTDAADFACRIETEQDGPVTKLEIKPKTPQCGIKGVFASLWNTRAIDFYRSLVSVSMEEWTTQRVTGDALQRLGGAALPITY